MKKSRPRFSAALGGFTTHAFAETVDECVCEGMVGLVESQSAYHCFFRHRAATPVAFTWRAHRVAQAPRASEPTMFGRRIKDMFRLRRGFSIRPRAR